jgi:hypothetical protein
MKIQPSSEWLIETPKNSIMRMVCFSCEWDRSSIGPCPAPAWTDSSSASSEALQRVLYAGDELNAEHFL